MQFSLWRNMVFCATNDKSYNAVPSDLKLSQICARVQAYPAGERLATLAADKGSGHKVGVVVAFEMHI